MAEDKPYTISKQVVWEAYQKVKANKGAAGVDGQSIEAFETDLKNNLYKVWNRMSSGSYFPPPVRLVEIPKATGGLRPLGIPTVADRVAQMVVKRTLEPLALSMRFLPSPVDPRPELNNATPSVRPHYRALYPTTGCSAPVPRLGTLILMGTTHLDFSLRIGATGPHVPCKSPCQRRSEIASAGRSKNTLRGGLDRAEISGT